MIKTSSCSQPADVLIQVAEPRAVGGGGVGGTALCEAEHKHSGAKGPPVVQESRGNV